MSGKIWELVGGPECGKTVVLGHGATRFFIEARINESAAISHKTYVPNASVNTLEGMYLCLTADDSRRNVMHWQGWS